MTFVRHTAARRAAAALVAILAPLLLVPWLVSGAWAKSVKPLPWHLVDYFYQMPAVPDFRSLAITVDVQGRAPAEGDFIFIAPLWGKIGNASFYFGMQTDLYHNATRRMAGPGFIFSRWGETTPEDARPEPGGWSAALTHAKSGEGDFVGVRLPYRWATGRYTFRIDARPDDGAVGQWLTLAVHEHLSGRRIAVGSLRFAVPFPGRTAPRPASFVELYARPAGQQLDAYLPPRFSVVFGWPLFNNGVRPLLGEARHDPAVPSLADVRESGNGITVAVGSPADVALPSVPALRPRVAAPR